MHFFSVTITSQADGMKDDEDFGGAVDFFLYKAYVLYSC